MEEVDKVSFCDEAVQVPRSVLLAVGEPMGHVILSSFSVVFHCCIYTALYNTTLKLTYSPVKPAYSKPAFLYSPIIQLRKAITQISPVQGCKAVSFDHGPSP